MQSQTKSQQVIFGYQQSGSKVDMETQKTQSNKHNIEGEKTSWRNGNVQLPDLI